MDTSDTLHHAMVRGIDGIEIFENNIDILAISWAIWLTYIQMETYLFVKADVVKGLGELNPYLWTCHSVIIPQAKCALKNMGAGFKSYYVLLLAGLRGFILFF
ncbi:MAG: hypothetical protein JRJ45_04485 [Deltaproteobacteria bacterium]|nr:hypothetical protein [Deltaproteobacteria bacterium]